MLCFWLHHRTGSHFSRYRPNKHEALFPFIFIVGNCRFFCSQLHWELSEIRIYYIRMSHESDTIFVIAIKKIPRRTGLNDKIKRATLLFLSLFLSAFYWKCLTKISIMMLTIIDHTHTHIWIALRCLRISNWRKKWNSNHKNGNLRSIQFGLLSNGNQWVCCKIQKTNSSKMNVNNSHVRPV